MKNNKLLASLHIGFICFAIYTCMYAIRKPFTAFILEEELGGINLKIWLVLFQLAGYLMSKFFGISFIGNLNRENRILYLHLCLITASLPLFILNFTPTYLWPVLFLINGFPLGLVWGIVFSYAEGRNFTELIGSILACTFIFSSGIVKFLAINLQNSLNINMELTLSLMALGANVVAFLLALLLKRTPPPDIEDETRNVKRTSLNKIERKKVFLANASIIIPAILMYCIFTVLRDIRDNFTAEILQSDNLYSANNIAYFETILALLLILTIPFLTVVKKHYKAINLIFIVCLLGSLLNIMATVLYNMEVFSGTTLFLCSGLGLYCGYILINISLMDRIIGFTKTNSNAGFLMYIADSAGYIASFGAMLFFIFGKSANLDWHHNFTNLLIISGLATAIISIYNMGILYKMNKKTA